MNTLTRTIAVLIALSILTPGLALAQDVSATEARDADVAKKEAEIAVLAARKRAEIAREQAKVAAKYKEEDLRQAKIASTRARSMSAFPGTGYSTASTSRIRWPFQSGGGASVFVIPSAEIETKDLLAINEDINVMSRIFETNLQQAHISLSGGTIFISNVSRTLLDMMSRSKSTMQSLYLQGYGVVFLMKVDFPLSPPHRVQQEDVSEKEEEGDKVWKDMRRQLYEPEQLVKRKADDSAVKYDAEKVENLKMTLIKALKHAANIRNLKPEESAILTITGGGRSVDSETALLGLDRYSPRTKMLVRDKKAGEARMIEGSSEPTFSWRKVLMIRARKADIDSFAKGDLNLEQFRQRVQMISYPYLAGETGHRSALGMMYEDYAGTRY